MYDEVIPVEHNLVSWKNGSDEMFGNKLASLGDEVVAAGVASLSEQGFCGGEDSCFAAETTLDFDDSFWSNSVLRRLSYNDTGITTQEMYDHIMATTDTTLFVKRRV